jgi:DNA-binding transcriptional ArsR family regulator
VAKDSAARRRAAEHDERRPPAAGAPQLRPVAGAGAGGENVSDEGALGLDRLIHERMRLGIVSALAANDTMTFNDLKLLLGTTDGNLSVHARKLEDAKYITCTKSFEGRMPRTEYKLTADGRRALKRYVDHMEALIRAIRER